MRRWLALALVILLALGAYVAAGPWLAVRAIRAAVKEHDAAALSAEVDFTALRASLKAQLGDRLVRRAGADAQASLFGAFGLELANGMVGGLVDAMVTPTGLGALMEGRKVWRRVDDGIGSPAPADDPLRDAHYRYDSPSRFTATIRDGDDDPIVFVLTRDGLRWRLSDIRLPE